MKKMMKWSLLIAMVGIGSVAMAQNRPDFSSPGGIKARVERMAKQLDLKEAQKKEITKIYTESAAAMKNASRETRMEQRTANQKKINAVLTAEQQKKLAEIREQQRKDRPGRDADTDRGKAHGSKKGHDGRGHGRK